jgi:hypothetical protein
MKKLYPALTVLSIFFLVTGFILAQQPEPGQRPSQEAKAKAFEGELTKVDATAKALWVKGLDGKEMKFKYTDQTEIIGADSVEGLATKSGAMVTVHFDQTRTASRIEVQGKSKKSPQ